MEAAISSTLLWTNPMTAAAKIIFNTNDFWYDQWHHLAGTRSAMGIINEAAI